ncbi:MAG: hypothetical protein HY231_04885 [Acidobacteria bacterium]|nr:hypothetical protein [Acidobacteriota bacterium]
MELKDHIEQIRDNLRLGQFINEASVSQGIVLRILQILGWPIFDSQIVSPEYALEGRRVDYALCHPAKKPLVFIEVKQVGQSEGADRQLFEYAFHIGVPMAVLTDGQEWHFYLPGEQGQYQERRVYKLDLLERSIDECLLRLTRYLAYDSSCSGKALEAARRDYQNVARDRLISATLPQAWSTLIQEPEELLIELLADKVESLCGYKPEPDTVASFLTNGSPIRHLTEVKSSGSIPEKPKHLKQYLPQETSPRHIASAPFRLQGRDYEARSARDAMSKIFEELSKRDSSFLERFAARPKHGKKRRFVARSKDELYPDRPDLAESNSYQLSGGWWIGTNYSRKNIEDIIKMGCEVAGLNYGTDLVVKFD